MPDLPRDRRGDGLEDPHHLTGWLSVTAADVPGGDGWLTAAERERAAAFRMAKRAEEWRLRRWAGKSAVARWLEAAPAGAGSPAGIEIANESDGSPVALRDGVPLPVSLSLSDRAGRAVALVAPVGVDVGCDVELVEPRSDAFVRDYFDDAEQALLAAAPDRDVAANLLWSAKESVLKVLREGLRRAVRSVQITFVVDDLDAPSDWRPWSARLAEGGVMEGWWRADGDFVLTAASRPLSPPPTPLAPYGAPAPR